MHHKIWICIKFGCVPNFVLYFFKIASHVSKINIGISPVLKPWERTSRKHQRHVNLLFKEQENKQNETTLQNARERENK